MHLMVGNIYNYIFAGSIKRTVTKKSPLTTLLFLTIKIVSGDLL